MDHQTRGLEPKEYQELCDRWANFSAFSARCNASGLNKQKSQSLYVGRDIPNGLEDIRKPGLRRDCEILVATQHVLLSGSKLYDDIAKTPEEGSKLKKWGQDEWRLWTKRFHELAAEYEGSGQTEMAAVLTQAHEKMVSLAA